MGNAFRFAFCIRHCAFRPRPSAAGSSPGLLGELSDREAAHGVDEIRRDRRERLQHEQPVSKARMWELKIPLLHDAVAEQDQVEIQRPRRTAVRPFAVSCLFDRQQRGEKRPRLRLSPARRGGIEKGRLGGNTFWSRFDEGGNRQIGEEVAESIDGKREMSRPVAEVTAQRDRSRPRTPEHSGSKLPCRALESAAGMHNDDCALFIVHLAFRLRAVG